MKPEILIIITILLHTALGAPAKSFRMKGLFRPGAKKMSYKTMTKILGAGAKGAIGASILSEIGSINHGSTWKFDYFDHKFNLISTNMGLMEDELKNMANYIKNTLKKKIGRAHV